MIHDACVEVTCDGKRCDGKRCTESVYVALEWMYRNYDESSGFWAPKDSTTEKRLVRDHDWVVRDGKHFCSPECATEEPT